MNICREQKGVEAKNSIGKWLINWINLYIKLYC